MSQLDAMRDRALQAEQALIDALAHIEDLHAQIDAANAAAARIARRFVEAVRSGAVRGEAA